MLCAGPRQTTRHGGARAPGRQAARRRGAGRGLPRAAGGRMSDRMRRIHRIHFVGIGGSGMSGIAEVLVESRLRSAGQRSQAQRGHRAPGAARRARASSVTPRQNIGEADVVVISSAVSDEQPGSGRGAGEAHSGGAARRNARRADALPLRHRGRRHARQDHHHQSHLVDPGRGRRGSRPSSSAAGSRAPAPTRASAPASTWSRKPTRATPRSCT